MKVLRFFVRAFRRVCIGLAALLLVLLVLHTALNVFFGIRLSLALRKARAQHIPLTAAEIRRPHVPDEENAAPFYRRAYEVIKEYPFHDGGFHGGETSVYAWKKLPPVAAEEFSLLVREGSTRPACNFDLDLEAGINTPLEHITVVYRLWLVLLAKANDEARRGASAEAFKTLLLGMRMANHLGEEPDLSSGFLRHAILSRATQRFLTLSAGRLVHEEEAMAVLQEYQRFRREDWLRYDTWGTVALVKLYESMLRHSMVPMVSFALCAYPRPDDPGGVSLRPAKGPRERFLLWLAAPVLKYDFRRFIVISCTTGGLFRAPLHEVARDIANLDADGCLPRYIGPERELRRSPFLSPYANWFLQGRLEERRSLGLRTAQMHRCILGLAVKAYQARHGHFPETLAQLSPGFLPAVPLNEFTGQPILYRRIPGGFEIIIARRNDESRSLTVSETRSGVTWGSPPFRWEEW